MRSSASRKNEDDSTSYSDAIWVGLGLAAFYFASRRWLSEGAFSSIAITVFLLYMVTGVFRNHWRERRFWAATVLLFGGHAALLWYLTPHLHRWSFWGVMKVVAPEFIVMVLILGWILGDNYFTRNTRRKRARAAAQKRAP